MGDLYLARDSRLGRQVAIKLLREQTDSEGPRDRLLHEARAAASVHHPNAVTIFDVGEHDHQPFIAMEYLVGKTLEELIRQKAPLALPRKLEIMRDVCSGVAAMHRAGLIHRDLKPSNIMVGDDGVVKILDFGVARAIGSPGRPGTIIGTLSYMSPEQLMGRPADARTDVFAVAAVLYEVLAYRHAFSGGADTFQQLISRRGPTPLTQIVPGIDPHLERIVARGLEEDPRNRYQSIEEMRADLERCEARIQRRGGARIVALRSWLSSRFSTLFRGRGAERERLREDTLAPDDDTGMSDATIAPGASPDQLPDVGAVGGASRDATVFLQATGISSRAESRSNAQLVLAGSGRVFPITAPRMEIGRAECDITIADASVSRRHAVIESAHGGFSISDLGSSYGTFVNGRLIRETTPLFFGAMINIGSVMMVFSSGADGSLPDLTACTIGDRYTLTRKLRESAKGAAYAAADRNVRSEVAIKLLSPHLAGLPGYREQFDREIEIAGQLSHPNICRVLDSGPASIRMKDGSIVESIFLTYPLMAGGNLADRLAARDAVPLDRAVQWIETLAAALAHSHRRDIVHGDLKPTAIVFDQDDNPYLSDFAFGQHALNADRRPTLGSPAYMSPEQWEDGIAIQASDQFALAVIAYCLLTGTRPFVGQENPEVRAMNFHRGPIPAHKRASQHRQGEFNQALSGVLARALAVVPGDRFPAIDEFAKALKKAVRGIVDSPEVFLSYRRGTSAGWANTVAGTLKDRHGMRVFLDVAQIDSGPFPDRIMEAIRNCHVFVCLLGDTTLDSKWVLREIDLAHQFGKPMIPIRQESFDDSVTHGDAAVRALLGSQGVPLLDVHNEYVEEAIARVATLITRAIRKDRDD